MSLLHNLRLRLRALFQKRELETHMDDELRSHIEMQTQENIKAGMDSEEARCAALRQFGWVESIKERCREQRGVGWIENLLQDLRCGARMLGKDRGFTAVVVLTLALGIGGSTAIYSVVNTVIFNPVPGSEPDRLIQIGERSRGNKDEPRFGGVATPSLEILRTKEEFFSDIVWSADFLWTYPGVARESNFRRQRTQASGNGSNDQLRREARAELLSALSRAGTHRRQRAVLCRAHATRSSSSHTGQINSTKSARPTRSS